MSYFATFLPRTFAHCVYFFKWFHQVPHSRLRS
jgi:hypothetical protein